MRFSCASDNTKGKNIFDRQLILTTVIDNRSKQTRHYRVYQGIREFAPSVGNEGRVKHYELSC